MIARNPRYNGRVGVYRTNEIEKMTGLCDNTIAYPSGLPNPKLWYKGYGPTASVNTAGFNTVNSSSLFTFWYDFSGGGLNLGSSVGGAFYRYDPLLLKNGLPYFNSSGANYTYLQGSAVGSPGRGTLILIWYAGTSPSPLWFAKPGGFSLLNGYSISAGTTTILGDSQSYSFSNVSNNSWNIQVLSVASASNPIVYTNNGVQGTTASYTAQVGGGSIPIISFDNYNNSSLGEFLYFESPLTLVQCQTIESYLKTKWCLDY